jgi:hypothetical protein
MRSAVRKFCEKNEETKKFVELPKWKRSKVYQKFFQFIKSECDDNLEGFLIALIFLSNNRRIGKVRDTIRHFLSEGVVI